MFEALNNAVLFELIGGKVSTVGQVAIPDAIARDSRWAKVLSSGPGVPDMNGTILGTDVETGDTIYIMLHGKIEVDVSQIKEGEKIFAVGSLDIIGKLNSEGNFVPLGNFILIEKQALPQETPTGVLIPETHNAPTGIAKVVGLGLGWKSAFGHSIPFQVEVGDYVVFNPLNAMVIDWKPMGVDKEQFVVSHGDLIAKWIPE